MQARSERGTNTSVLESGSFVTRQSGRGRFLVVEGPDRGRSVPVGAGTLTLGSGSGADVVLADRAISRRHLAASLAERGVLVWDLGSTNGSFVQGARFTELLLGFGAEIMIGRTVLKYVPEEETVHLAPLESDRFGKLVGRDRRMRGLFRLLADVAPTESTVLIEGETGTGKELFAEELHAHSARAERPFVVFDCGAVSEELIQSALFGHVRGAFTGAVGDRKGAFGEADGGTLFLDEIGELALEVQPVLLRALDRRMVRAVGGAGYQQFDVRVVAATNRDLRAEVAKGRFREDLYYRLAVVKVHVPPLRERPDDLPLLVEQFARETAGGRPARIRKADLDALKEYGWPGNVRELRNVVERACLFLSDDTMVFELPAASDAAGKLAADAVAPGDVAELRPYRELKAEILDRFERDYFAALLARCGGNLSAAARVSQLDRKHLRDLLRKLGLRPDRE